MLITRGRPIGLIILSLLALNPPVVHAEEPVNVRVIRSGQVEDMAIQGQILRPTTAWVVEEGWIPIPTPRLAGHLRPGEKVNCVGFDDLYWSQLVTQDTGVTFPCVMLRTDSGSVCVRASDIAVEKKWEFMVGRSAWPLAKIDVFRHDFDGDGTDEIVVHWRSCTGGSTELLFVRDEENRRTVLLDFKPPDWQGLGGDENADGHDWEVLDLDGDGKKELIVKPSTCHSRPYVIPVIFSISRSIPGVRSNLPPGGWSFEDLDHDNLYEAIKWTSVGENTIWTSPWPVVYEQTGKVFRESSKRYRKWYATTFRKQLEDQIAQAEQMAKGGRPGDTWRESLQSMYAVRKKLIQFLSDK